MYFKSDKKPYDYQVEGAKFALSSFYSLNRDEPGLGKTIQALLAFCTHLDSNPNARCLVICPQYLRTNWMEEIKEWTHLSSYYFEQRNLSPLFDIDIVVISYDQLKYFSWSYYFEPITKVKKSCKLEYVIPKYVRKFRPLATLCDEKFDFVVADEIQNFKNPKALRTKYYIHLIDHLRPKFFLQLSGTPIKNKIYDLFIPLFLMAFGKNTIKKITDKYRSYFTFCYRFCDVVKTKYGTEFRGRKNVDELKTYLEGRVIARKKSECLSLPKTIEKFVVVDYKENPQLLQEYLDFNAGVKSATSELKKISAILTAPFTAEYCKDLFDKDVGPMIIFSDHREPVDILSEYLKKIGRVGIVKGGMGSTRDETIRKFKAGEIDFLIATIGSASEGLNLVRASHMIFNDLPWVPATLRQAMDRIDRIGQLLEGTYHIMTGPVVGKKIWTALKAKMALIRAVFEE